MEVMWCDKSLWADRGNDKVKMEDSWEVLVKGSEGDDNGRYVIVWAVSLQKIWLFLHCWFQQWRFSLLYWTWRRATIQMYCYVLISQLSYNSHGFLIPGRFLWPANKLLVCITHYTPLHTCKISPMAKIAFSLPNMNLNLWLTVPQDAPRPCDV